MEKVRGVVLELDRRQAVILTPGGEFRKVPVQGPLPRIGEEIEVTLPVARKRVGFNRLWAAVAAMLLLLVLPPALLNYFNQPSPAIAYVTIDINPSLELGIDEKQVVVEIRPLNRDGKKILSGIKVKGLQITQALQRITREAVSQGFIAPKKDNAVIVSLAPVNREKTGQLNTPALENQLQTTVEKALETQHLTAMVATLEVDSALREKALEYGLSAGKYAILLKAQEAGVSLDPENLKDTPVMVALKEAGADMSSVVGATYQEPVRVLLVEREKEVGLEKPKVALKKNADQGEDKQGGENRQIALRETAPAAGEPAATKKFQLIKPRLVYPKGKVKPSTKDNVYDKAYEEPRGDIGDHEQQSPPKDDTEPEGDPDPIILKPDPGQEPKPPTEPTPREIIIKPPRNPQ